MRISLILHLNFAHIKPQQPNRFNSCTVQTLSELSYFCLFWTEFDDRNDLIDISQPLKVKKLSENAKSQIKMDTKQTRRNFHGPDWQVQLAIKWCCPRKKIPLQIHELHIWELDVSRIKMMYNMSLFIQVKPTRLYNLVWDIWQLFMH